MDNFPCKECICLAICRSQANCIYDEIILADLDSHYDAFALMVLVGKQLITPLTQKCNYVTSYITKEDDESNIMLAGKNLLEMIAYLNSPLHDLYVEAREYTEKQYQQYLDNKNKKIDKDIRYG